MDRQKSPFSTPIPTAKLVRLCGQGFVGSNLDTNFRTHTAIGTGTYTQGNAALTQSTGVTANSSSVLTSTKPALFNSISRNVYHGHHLIAPGVVNNKRTWGAVSLTGGNPNNGFAYQITGKKFEIVKYRATIPSIVSSFEFSEKRKFYLDSLWHNFEIVYDNTDVSFQVDGEILHQECAQDILLSGGFQLPIYIANINSNGLAQNVDIQSSGPAIYREGEIESAPLYLNITAAGTYTLKTNAGILKAIMVNSTTGSACTIYDNTTAAGTKIGTIQLNQILTRLPNGGAYFSNGLTLVTTGAGMDVTVIWE